MPGHLRSDNGPEFVAKAVRDWVAAVVAKTAFIEPGSPWENGYCESFDAKLRDEFLNQSLFFGPEHARIKISTWTDDYNQQRPHSALGYIPPAVYAANLTIAAQSRAKHAEALIAAG